MDARGDTIAAVSTAPGEAAIAIVRLSGPEAIALADVIFVGTEKPSHFQSRVQHFGTIANGNVVIDQALLSVHRAPASYTGEDLVEISCHGGHLPAARVLEAALNAGARAARPGEFTERAFLNGKMDLIQAEAVIDLIRARTDLALRSAMEQLEGSLGRLIGTIRDDLVDLNAHVEASLDFADEDIAPDEGTKVQTRVRAIMQKISDLLATADRGRILREGVRVVIYGPTNAGKSSLLNRLLGYDRAIVSAAPGTTRDTVEESAELGGVLVRLRDTAGIRESQDDVEREGMARTRQSLEQSDLSLHVMDASAPRPTAFSAEVPDRLTVLVLNKKDLPEHPDWAGTSAVRISCKIGAGLDDLRNVIGTRIGAGNIQAESAAAINARHRDCLRRSLDSCKRADETITRGFTPDLYAMEIRAALDAIGELIGVVEHEQILDSVFAQFCIGK
jgi:tRNA modification GTPase